MKFCCEVSDLFDFYEKIETKKIEVNDYIDLNEKKNLKQPELDFEFYGSKPSIIKKEKKECSEEKVYSNDRNHELMIKYKYDIITDAELNELYKNLERVIYKIVKNNYVKENFEDVCNEIWRRIAKYKHKWDENKGVCVTTWIGKVAVNVIQTIRKRTMTYSSRNISYDGFFTYDKGGEAKEVDMEKLIADNKDNSGEERSVFYESIMDCFDVFDEVEKSIVNLCLNCEQNMLVIDDEKRTYKRRYASASFIKQKLKLTNAQYKKYIKSIGDKYVAKQQGSSSFGIDNGFLHRIF